MPTKRNFSASTSARTSAVFETVHLGKSKLHFHRHGVAFATFVVAGQYTEVRDGAPSLHRAGSVVLHGASEEHADFFSDAARCINVELPRDFNLPPLHVSDDETAARCAGAIVRAFDRSNDPAALDVPIAEFCGVLADRHSELEKPKPSWLEHVIASFDWTGAVPLREAARLGGVHQTHFARAFTRHMGMTANAYRREVRLRRATGLLLRSEESLVRIALSCGFGDQSHFSNAFRAAAGLSPSAFQRIFAR